MWILPLVGYTGLGLGFGFLTLAIGTLPAHFPREHMLIRRQASGLYYLSELVEEHTVFAKKLLTRLIYLVIGIQTFLCIIDGFPFWPSLLSVVSHVVYLGNMRRFPVVKLSDPLFIASCGILDFWVWEMKITS
jgi:hypothetical protein